MSKNPSLVLVKCCLKRGTKID